MMKKKHKEHEAAGEKQYNEQTDNKDNNRDNTGSGGNNYTTQDSIENGNTGTDGSATDEKNADKSTRDTKPAEEKLAEMQDKYIRLSAEFDNYRKRTLREKMDMSKYAGENLLLKLLPVMDDFDRAVKHMETASDCAAMKSGIDLIYGKLSEFLKQNGIKEIESLNNTFNVDIHEAIAKVPVPEDDKKGKVIDVVQKGYYLQDKVLRFSKVVVGE
jgi:molecular chaperone GrpE